MHNRIVMTTNVLFGKPRIKGTRISVEQVLACLAEDWTFDTIMKEFDLEREDIQAAIAFAQQSLSRTHFVQHSQGLHAEVSA